MEAQPEIKLKVRTFKITDETLEALKKYKNNIEAKSWDECFRKLLTLTPPVKQIVHTIKELPPCIHRMVACSKKMENIKLEQCLTCGMREVKYVIT